MAQTIDFVSLLHKSQEYISENYAAALSDRSKIVQLRSYIEKYLHDSGFEVEGMTFRELADKLYSEMAEYSVLTKYLGRDEIEEIKSAAAEAPLKVILETGALQTAENIKKASILSIYAGADFIKTSTGKIEPAATPEAALVMCQTIREYYKLTGTKIGFKAAGGINTVSDAVGYYTIVREILGEEWIKEGLFRIGTSRLANLLVSEILGENCKPF